MKKRPVLTAALAVLSLPALSACDLDGEASYRECVDSSYAWAAPRAGEAYFGKAVSKREEERDYMVKSICPVARDGKDWRASTPQWLQGIASLPSDYRPVKPPYYAPEDPQKVAAKEKRIEDWVKFSLLVLCFLGGIALIAVFWAVSAALIRRANNDQTDADKITARERIRWIPLVYRLAFFPVWIVAEVYVIAVYKEHPADQVLLILWPVAAGGLTGALWFVIVKAIIGALSN